MAEFVAYNGIDWSEMAVLVRSGKTESSLALLAMRRVELRIDRELKHAARQLAS